MSVQSALRRFRIAPAPADIFTDPGSGFVYPQIEAAEYAGNPKYYPREFQVADQDRFRGILGEDENVGLKFTTDGRSFGGSPAGAGSAVQAGEGENGLLLKSVFGNQTKDTGGLLAAGTTATVLKMASTTNISVGNLVGVVDPATGLFHVRQVRSKTGTDLTLDRLLPFTPLTGATIYASASYSHASQGHQHMWFDLEGYDPTAAQNWRRYVRGCLGDLAFNTDGRLRLEWEFKGVDLYTADGASQGAPTYPANMPSYGTFASKSTRVYVGSALQKIQGLTFKLGNKINPKMDAGSVNGLSDLFIAGYEPTISFSMLHDDGGAAMISTFNAGNLIDLLIELTQGGPGNAFALAAPFVEAKKYTPVSINGLDGYSFELGVTRCDTIAGVPALTLAAL